MASPHDTIYRAAVSALDQGDLGKLEDVIDQYPRVMTYRCRSGEWYEEGYFRGAVLLHHIAGNPNRGPVAPNIADVTRLLLSRGADPNVATDDGGTTIGLLLTSKQASDSQVSLTLIDLLMAAGARADLETSDTLSLPLLNCASWTAEELVRRGTPMDLRHAAALGKADELPKLFSAEGGRELRDEALLFACIRGQKESARVLIELGAEGDVLLKPGGQTPRTALHEAANRGHFDIVKMLLDSGVDPSVVERRWNGTAAGWAKQGGHPEIAAWIEKAIKGT